MDERLFKPGWAGELGDDELAFIKGRLLTDKALARRWGFRPGAKLRPDRAIRAVAQDGDPDNIALNRSLARGSMRIPAKSCTNGQSSDMKPETCRSETDNQASQSSHGLGAQGALVPA